jgi:hypothetical protein
MSGTNTGASKTVEAVVARGRSLQGPKGETFKPGDTVVLDTAEAKRLRKLGFLASEDEVKAIRRPGPAIHGNEGPRVTPLA